METSPTPEEIKANALRYAGNTWRRFLSYQRRYMKKYGKTTRTPPSPNAFFDNRIYEDTYAMTASVDPSEKILDNGKRIEQRQKLADPLVTFRSRLEDPSEFDTIFAASIARRIEGYEVSVSHATSASRVMHEKDSIRTFVTKATKAK